MIVLGIMNHNQNRRKALINFLMLACICQEGGAFTAITRSAGVSITPSMRERTTVQRVNTRLESHYESDQSATELRASADPNSAGVNGDSTPSTDYVPDDVGRFRFESYALVSAAAVGILGGWSVGIFKLAIEAVRVFSYGNPIAAPLLPLIPAAGGVMVALLKLPGAYPPGLKGTIVDSDNDARLTASGEMNNSKRPFAFLRKSLASVCTLGTGNSLGPEGPSVEIGVAIGRVCSNVFPPFQYLLNRPNGENNRPTKDEVLKRNRLLLSCGAAAGVSAGFNAPLAGVFFALEIVENAFAQASSDEKSDGIQDVPSEDLSSSSITSILLSSVLSALVSRAILGNHLALEVTDYTLRTPLIELPLYLLLGATSGVVAFLFSQTAKLMKNLFDGKAGPESLRDAAKSLPSGAKPVIGGLLCGLIGLAFPQVLFFGYETLNSLLASTAMSTTMLLTLLVVKTISTALCAGSGLVGGTFAPALFLGAMTGASFHNIMCGLLKFGENGDMGFIAGYAMQLADLPAYAMVGAASVLAALFRAPLTASLLLFELTRDYDVILPLMASAGIGSLVGDIIESKVERQKQVVGLRRDKDPVSWGDLASSKITNDKE